MGVQPPFPVWPSHGLRGQTWLALEAGVCPSPPLTPPGQSGLTILGLGVSGRDVPSPAWRSPGTRGRGISGKSLGPAEGGQSQL